MLKTTLPLCLIALAASSLIADETHVVEDVWFELADCYQGKAVFAVEGDGKAEDWKRVEFFLCKGTLSMRSFRFESDGSVTLYDERHANDAESMTIYHEHSSVSMSSRFRETLTDAGEREISPMQIQRLIHERRDEIGIHIVERHDDATVTVGFSLTTLGHTEEHEFDVRDRRITAYRSAKRDGKFFTEVQYGGWQILDDGQPVPTRMHSRIGFGVDEIVMTIRVESARSVTAAQAPSRPEVPSGFVVQRSADQVHTRTPAASPSEDQRSMPRSRNTLSRIAAPILILAGGVLIGISAVIVVVRIRRS
ncbi:MAG: hypothetical protein NXI07_00325 [bacterium]|nr:hypothetical protein [bacterium]